MPVPILGPDGNLRCSWSVVTPEYIHYHDTEWGVPQKDDRVLFEKISLEGFQAGLSWITILRKRENFRKTNVCRRGLHGVVCRARPVQNIATEEACP